MTRLTLITHSEQSVEKDRDTTSMLTLTVDYHANMCCVTEPFTSKEALASPNAKEWQEAADLMWDFDLPRDRRQ